MAGLASSSVRVSRSAFGRTGKPRLRLRVGPLALVAGALLALTSWTGGCKKATDAFELRYLVAYAILVEKEDVLRVDVTADLLNGLDSDAARVKLKIVFGNDVVGSLDFGSVASGQEAGAYVPMKLASPLPEGELLGGPADTYTDANEVHFAFCKALKSVSLSYEVGGQARTEDLTEQANAILAGSVATTIKYIERENALRKASLARLKTKVPGATEGRNREGP